MAERHDNAQTKNRSVLPRLLIVKTSTILLCLIGLATTLCGCMHTYIAGGLGRDSPDGKYRVTIVSHGASGQAYVDKTKKRVYVSVWPMATNSLPAFLQPKPDNPPPVFQAKHIFVAGDLWWHTRWLTNDEVEITFYDYGDKVLVSHAEKMGMVSNRVAIITLRPDPKTGHFIETLSRNH
jgi:hypothetical protein